MPDNDRPVSPVNGVPLPVGRPFTQGEQQREIARKGGIASAEAKRARKTLREELLLILDDLIPDKQGNMVPIQKAMSTALIKSAIGGSVRAFEVIRDTIGEKPAENVTLTSGSFAALDEAFAAIARPDKDADPE